MHFKYKKIHGKRYKYAVKSLRLPDGRVVSLEKLYKTESSDDLDKIFLERELQENIKYVCQKYGTDSIFTEAVLKSIEEIKLSYKQILKRLTSPSQDELWNRFTANFTYESNALEGNSLTLKDVSMVMFENISLRGKDLREIYETRNSREVVELIIKNTFSISEKDIIKMHQLLVKDLGVRTGYKQFPNVILGKMIETTPPEKVSQEMKGLLQWYSQNSGKVHPLKLAALFHGKFERIHPFEDGNGRVGRFLINVILIKHKYQPLIIRKSQRVSYLKALSAFDSGYTGAMERLILEKFKETYRKFFEIYVKYI